MTQLPLSIEKMRINEGDFVVVTYKPHVSQHERQQVVDQIKAQQPRCFVVLAPEGADVDVLPLRMVNQAMRGEMDE